MYMFRFKTYVERECLYPTFSLLLLCPVVDTGRRRVMFSVAGGCENHESILYL